VSFASFRTWWPPDCRKNQLQETFADSGLNAPTNFRDESAHHSDVKPPTISGMVLARLFREILAHHSGIIPPGLEGRCRKPLLALV